MSVFTMAIWWRLNGELAQQGPGSDDSTLRALEAIGPLPDVPRILDMGCGPGRQTRVLARATRGTIHALDRLPPFLALLRARSQQAGLASRIHAVCADMARPPFAPESFDLVWSEGAVYIPGFEAGLRSWCELLRPGGLAAVTELSWVGDPPGETRAFWEEAYPAVADVRTNCARAQRAGYEIVSTFPLPPDDWTAYYAPIEARAKTLRPEYENDPESLTVLSAHQEEMNVLERSNGSYTYVFYLLKKR